MPMPPSMHPAISSCARAVSVGIALPARLFVLASNAAVGGQAVMEGVMMRSPNHWAVALRRRSGDIVELHRVHHSFARRHRWARLPIVRGPVALFESLGIGFRALSVSGHYAAADLLEEEEAEELLNEKYHEARKRGDIPWAAALTDDGGVEPGSAEDRIDLIRPEDELPPHVGGKHEERDALVTSDDPAASPESLGTWQLVLAFVMALGFSIALFKLFPAFLTDQLFVSTKSGWFVFYEASLKITIFCVYLALIGLIPDMKRVFQYHSAEHKAINAWENEVPLEPAAVNGQSRIHVRCGTAFMLWVFVVAIGVFGAFGYYVKPNIWEVLASRVVLLPLVAGLSFELIKFAGKHPNNRLVRGILSPGLWLQRLTTRECTDEHCEVAIRSLELVLKNEYPDATLEEARVESSSDEDEAMQVMA